MLESHGRAQTVGSGITLAETSIMRYSGEMEAAEAAKAPPSTGPFEEAWAKCSRWVRRLCVALPCNYFAAWISERSERPEENSILHSGVE